MNPLDFGVAENDHKFGILLFSLCGLRVRIGSETSDVTTGCGGYGTDCVVHFYL